MIEVDGDTHYTPVGLDHDHQRDAFLIDRNYRVLHFTNDDVLHNGEGVYDTIVRALNHATEHTANAQ